MTFGQALVYFFKEAFLSLARSWKISLLAILTIGISLFIGGIFLFVTQNLSRTVREWRSELKVVVYFRATSDEALVDAVHERAAAPRWVESVEEVSAEEASERFQETFPSLADLARGWGDEPFPRSLEITLDAAQLDSRELEDWIGRLRQTEGVDMVDDDRDWLRQLEALIAALRGIGLALGLTLLGAAIFTIASVIRLTAYLYLEEIAIMRLVGATEFFIRGPFYAEGFLQGLLGGLLAVLALVGAYSILSPAETDTAWLPLLAQSFLSTRTLLLLVALGAAAGLFGAMVSLRRETLSAERGPQP